MIDIPRAELERLYVDEGLTSREIADIFSVGFRTILRRLHQYDINVPPPGPKRHRLLRSREWLYRQYWELGKSTPQIASDIGCGTRTIAIWMKNHGIQARPRGAPLKGKKMSKEGRRKISVARRGRYTGPDNWNWKGGYKDPTYLERRRYRAKKWSKAVKERDGYQCVKCGATENLCSHHIKPWRWYPKLRFDVDNGMTLCAPCHDIEHGWSAREAYGAKAKRA